jgi:hypothetical protein
MGNNTGTVEAFAVRIAQILQPLVYECTSERAGKFFQEIGIYIPVDSLHTVLNEITDIGNKADLILRSAQRIINAINTEDAGDVIAEGEAIVKIIQALITDINDLKDAVADISGVDLPAVDQLLQRILYRLIIRYLEKREGLVPMLEFLDILHIYPHNTDGANANLPAYNLYEFNFNSIGAWIGDTAGQLKRLYKWGDPAFDGKLLFAKLEKILLELGVPAFFDDAGQTARLNLLVADVVPDMTASPAGLKLDMLLPAPAIHQEVNVPGWKSAFNLDMAMPMSSTISMMPGGKIEIKPPTLDVAINGKLQYKLTGKKEEPFILFSVPGGSRVQVDEIQVVLNAELQWQPAAGKADGKLAFEASLKGGKIIINADTADSFLQSILPPVHVEVDFDLKLGWSAATGFYIDGSSALEINLPVKKTIGPVAVDGLSIGFKPKDKVFPLIVGANITANLGPVSIAIQEIGASATLSFPAQGNFGFAQLDVGFKPPKGIGLQIDASMVKGGGFLQLDTDKGEYVGALELSINNTIQVAAIGIINTKLPNGEKGFSLLIIISATFQPGIALGMGFFLGGLGGMLGIHRTIHVPALLDGVANNSISNILFPTNIVKNINTLLPQIKSLFPVHKDQFFIGLMARITWGVPTLVRIDFGVAVEFPNPVRLVILGVLKVALPTEDKALLKLQVNFAGVIDFDRKYLAFDAALVNSKLLSFALEGQMALRLSWGSTKAFLLSAGGFHPAYKPPAELKVPSLKRITLTIYQNNPYLVLTSYFAVTSNTVQLGAKVDFKYKISKFNIVGFMSFDVLFQFSPFYFEARIAAGLSVKCGNTTLLSLSLDFTLSGPTPWHARGTAKFSILFISVKVRLNVTWGEAKRIMPPTVSVLPAIIEALQLPANWTVEAPASRPSLVTLGKMETAPGEVMLQPYGTLKISQTLLPLNIEITQFGNATPADIKSVSIKSFTLAGIALQLEPVNESFAPSGFRKMKDGDKLKAPSYSQEAGGIRVKDDSSGLYTNFARNRSAAFDITVADNNAPASNQTYEVNPDIHRKMTKGGAIGKSPLSAIYSRQKQEKSNVTVSEETYVVMDNDKRVAATQTKFSSGTRAQAEDAMNSLLKEKPALKGLISVVPAYTISQLN